MTADRLDVFLEALPLTLVRELARRAEKRGFRNLWLPEITFADAFIPAAAAAMETSRVGLATGVVGIWSRSPVTMALTAGTLNQLCSGRMILGLGLQARTYVEDWHGAHYGKTVTAMREYLTIVRRILAGENVTFQGEVFRVKNFQLHMAPPEKPIPIYMAAIGPKMLQLAGEIADGVLGYFYSLPYLEQVVLPNLEIGAKRAGRSLSRDHFDVAVGLPSIITDDDSGLRLNKGQVVMFATAAGSSPFYAESIARAGFQDELRRIQELVAKKDARGAVASVSDEMADALTISGKAEHARSRIAALRKSGATTVVLNPSPPGMYFPLFQGHFPEGTEIPPFNFPEYVKSIEKILDALGSDAGAGAGH
jgi:probable F420-dependent oxidoreductase